MVERKMDLEEATRHYNEQLERINEWKRKNLDISRILEMRTVTDFINAYDEGISSLEEDGVPEEVLVTLRKERDELGKRLAETEYRIKRLERTKEAEENRYGYAHSPSSRAGSKKRTRTAWIRRRSSIWRSASFRKSGIMWSTGQGTA